MDNPLATVWAWAAGWWQTAAEGLTPLFYPPPSTAPWVLLVSPGVLLFLGALAGYTLKARAYRPALLLLLMPGIVLAAAVVFRVPTIVAGGPDNNCDKYEGGNLRFTLENAIIVAANAEQQRGPKLLVMQVRAYKYFGNAMHTCVLPMNSDMAQKLARIFFDPQKARNRQAHDGYSALGFQFTFNGKEEYPNVAPIPGAPPGKLVPPDKPPVNS
ncbi:MAG: hypothetical protein GC129_06255 [Proteobacteria bacterium]|nr:hypothetical protein [Pseudomonadota bacterium]